MSEAPGSESGLLAEVALALEPVGEAGKKAAKGDPQPLDQLLSEMGLDRTAIGEAYKPVKADIQRIGDAWNTIETKVITPLRNDEAPDLSAIDEIFEALGEVFSVLTGLDDISVPKADFDRVGERVIDYLLIKYLADHHVLIYSGFALLGVIDPEGPGAAGDLDLSRLGPALSDPNSAIQDGFEWGTPDFEPYLVLFYVKGILNGFGLDARMEPVTKYMATEIQEREYEGGDDSGGSESGESGGIDPAGPPEELSDDRMVIDVLSLASNAASIDIDLNVIPVPGQRGNLPGLAVMPAGFAKGKTSEEIGGAWTFNASFSAEADWALRVRPATGGGLTVDKIPSKGVREDLHGEADLTYDPGSDDDVENTPLLGTGDGSSVGVKYYQASATLDFVDDELTYVVETRKARSAGGKRPVADGGRQ